MVAEARGGPARAAGRGGGAAAASGAPPPQPLLPLVRLRVDYTGYSTINSQRFGQKFVNKVGPWMVCAGPKYFYSPSNHTCNSLLRNRNPQTTAPHQVANPNDILLWTKAAQRKAKAEGAAAGAAAGEGAAGGLRPEALDQVRNPPITSLSQTLVVCLLPLLT
jgi:double-strand break repair protein MRE11